MTLAFVGNADRAECARLCDLAQRLPFSPFSLKVDKLSGFEQQHLVWAGLQQIPDELRDHVMRLRTALSQANVALDPREFCPHVTLKRNVRGPISEICLPFELEWQVERWRLVMSSPGSRPRYQCLAEWPPQTIMA